MNSESDLKSDDKIECKGFSNNVRYFLVTLCGLATGFMFLCRLNITVSIMSMVNHTYVHLMKNGTNLEDFMDADYTEVSFNIIWKTNLI